MWSHSHIIDAVIFEKNVIHHYFSSVLFSLIKWTVMHSCSKPHAEMFYSSLLSPVLAVPPKFHPLRSRGLRLLLRWETAAHCTKWRERWASKLVGASGMGIDIKCDSVLHFNASVHPDVSGGYLSRFGFEVSIFQISDACISI